MTTNISNFALLDKMQTRGGHYTLKYTSVLKGLVKIFSFSINV